MKKFLSMFLALILVLSLGACGQKNAPVVEQTPPPATEPTTEPSAEPEATPDTAPDTEPEADSAVEDYHIGIITGTVSQSEDDLRGAQLIQENTARRWSNWPPIPTTSPRSLRPRFRPS